VVTSKTAGHGITPGVEAGAVASYTDSDAADQSSAKATQLIVSSRMPV
jgi:hypothetical protein